MANIQEFIIHFEGEESTTIKKKICEVMLDEELVHNDKFIQAYRRKLLLMKKRVSGQASL